MTLPMCSMFLCGTNRGLKILMNRLIMSALLSNHGFRVRIRILLYSQHSFGVLNNPSNFFRFPILVNNSFFRSIIRVTECSDLI